MTKVVYMFDEGELVDKTFEMDGDGSITTHFKVLGYSMIRTLGDSENYSIDLLTKNGDIIAKGLTQEEYDNLPDAIKENAVAYEILSIAVRKKKD